jgi:hypothetical protein
MIEFNLACYASVTGHLEKAKARLQRAIELKKEIRRLALDDEDLRPLLDWGVGVAWLRRSQADHPAFS